MTLDVLFKHIYRELKYNKTSFKSQAHIPEKAKLTKSF